MSELCVCDHPQKDHAGPYGYCEVCPGCMGFRPKPKSIERKYQMRSPFGPRGPGSPEDLRSAVEEACTYNSYEGGQLEGVYDDVRATRTVVSKLVEVLVEKGVPGRRDEITETHSQGRSYPMKALYQFCGLGGGALGFQKAGFESVGAFDVDPAAVADFELLTGEKATVADLMTIQPHEMAMLCTGRPDVVFTSPPCKGFSGCLPTKMSKTDKYVNLNSLAQRGMWLALEAWEKPPPLIVLENVPRIMSRGREWLDQITAMLHAYGYAVKETTHDCGELGGLAQHRRRFLLVARHMDQVPEFLYEPPAKRVRGIGEVLSELPVPLPGDTTAGAMHRLPKLSAMNWVRLALIRAGKDWRDLPPSVELHTRSGRQNGGFGVEDWQRPSHSVLAEGSVKNTRASVADPRVTGAPRAGVYGVSDGNKPASTVTGAAGHDNGSWSVTDPRVDTIRREGGHGVKGWDEASTPVISAASIHNWPAAVADPRLTHEPHRGTLRMHGWAEPSHVIIGAAGIQKGNSLADPRVPTVVGPAFDIDDKKPRWLVIRAADGTWHRPMTTLELAALQGFPIVSHNGEWLQLTGRSHAAWRGRIGNAVPPPAAEAIARSCATTLKAAGESRFLLSGQPVWVAPPPQRLALELPL